jgi:arabinose-5-phosphate isomerase
MVQANDVVVALSQTGETEELIRLLHAIKRIGATIISITGFPKSTLGQASDVSLSCHVAEEACPMNLAPTASTTAALALGDALAVALLEKRGFSADDFARSHPRGQLPRQALVHVAEVMRKESDVPRVQAGSSAMQAIAEMTRGRIGMTAVVDDAGHVVGVFTDGDLRRSLEKGVDLARTRIDAVMTAGARTIRPEALAVEAVQIMERHKVNQLLVVDAQGVLIGALNMHDLFRARVI